MPGNAQSGRKPKPTAAKKLAGTFREDRHNSNEPEVEPFTKAPPCPTYVKGMARAAWVKHAKILTDMGVLTPADLHALEVYCETYARWREANDKLREYGIMLTQVVDGERKFLTSPYLRISEECAKAMRQWMNEFGITPSSRSKVSGSKKTKQPEADPYDFFGQPSAN